MKRMMGGAAILAVVAALTPPQIDAQRGPGARRGADGPRGAGIEAIMRMQERLELSESQLDQLDAIRRETVARRTAHQAEMEELRSQVAAGRLEASALREQMEARREGAEAVREQERERIEAVLNEAQRAQLEELQARGRAFRAGRASAMRPGDRPGMRQGRDFRRQAPGRGRGQGRDGMGFRAPGFRQDYGRAFRGPRPFRRGGPPEEIGVN